MGLTNRFQNGQAWFGNARVISGDVPRTSSTGFGLAVDSTGIDFVKAGFLSNTGLFNATPDELLELEILGSESRFTATRLVTLGLAGAGLKKNRTLVRIERRDGKHVVVEVRADEATTRSYFRQIAWVRKLEDLRQPEGHQQSAPLDLASQLKDLARLRDEGILSTEEFERAKAKLLG